MEAVSLKQIFESFFKLPQNFLAHLFYFFMNFSKFDCSAKKFHVSKEFSSFLIRLLIPSFDLFNRDIFVKL